jgi:hypothetical protein
MHYSGELHVPDNNEWVSDEPTVSSVGPQGTFVLLHCTASHPANAVYLAHLHSTIAKMGLGTC